MGEIKVKTEVSKRGEQLRHWKIFIDGADAELQKIEKVNILFPIIRNL